VKLRIGSVYAAVMHGTDRVHTKLSPCRHAYQTWCCLANWDDVRRVLYQRSLRTRNKAEAAQLEAVFKSSLVKKEFGFIESRLAPTLEQFEERLLPHLRANNAVRTYGFYKENLAVLKRFKPLASYKLSGIDAALIENFIQWRLKENVSLVTVNHSLRTLRRALYLAKKWKLIRDVPVINLLPGEHERKQSSKKMY
jgi:hypothetical protein